MVPIQAIPIVGIAVMPGILHHPYVLECTVSTTANGVVMPNLFELGIRYHESGNVQRYSRVHIPLELQTDILNANVHAVHLEPLDSAGVARRVLEGMPNYLAMGLVTKQRQRISALPRPLHRARKRREVWGLFACALSIGLLPLSLSAIVGALGLVMGTCLIRAAQQIPNRPFFISAECGWSFPGGN
jgi:hypothetical protein